MAYNANIPQASDVIAISQSDLLNNFGAINTFVNVNHVAFNGADQGKHSQITFPLGPLSGQPFAYAAGEIGLQSLNQVPTSRPDIWMSRGTATAFPITGYDQNGTTASWTYLPSGMKMIWGSASLASAAPLNIVYNSNTTGVTTFPGFTNIPNVQLTPRDNGAVINVQLMVGSPSNTQFTVLQRGTFAGNIAFYWSAIGM